MNYAKHDNYNKYPRIQIDSAHRIVSGYAQICQSIKKALAKKTVITVDCYMGVDVDAVLSGFSALSPVKVIRSEACALPEKEIDALLSDYLGDDRVFGYMCHKPLNILFDGEKLKKAKQEADEVAEGVVLVCGVGASLITRGDIHIFADMARWEIQNRYKAGMPNFCSSNVAAPFLTKYKRGFFVEWRMLDKLKKACLNTLDYILDTNAETPKLICGNAFRDGLTQAAQKPFRLVPYFDPGVWGGQWMKDVCALPRDKMNYAWSFDGVPEENSVYLAYGEEFVEIPAIDIVFYQPRKLLGERVHGRFGDEFPIRFDLLDTMDGGNLSLQVHPLTEFIQKTFGMNYTQDESYYILDCKEGAYAYLGVKDGVNPDEMLRDLEASQKSNSFDAEKYVNKVAIKKHDHILIPAGTVHCSAQDTMVLEISSTPYIFTFKMWDWSRIGLDGLPRPTHIQHGMKNVQFDRTPEWVSNNLIHQEKVLKQDANTLVERTGLHEREFIETIRYTTDSSVTIECCGSVNMLNLVEGSAVVVASPDNKFKPMTVHYAETFIVPAAAERYTISPEQKGEKIAVIQAKVR